MIDPQKPVSHNRLRESFEDLNHRTQLTVLFLLAPTVVVTLIAIILVIVAFASNSNLVDSLLRVVSPILTFLAIFIGASQALFFRRNKND